MFWRGHQAICPLSHQREIFAWGENRTHVPKYNKVNKKVHTALSFLTRTVCVINQYNLK